MGKTRICAIALLAMLAVSAAALTPSAGTDYTKAGVKVGDTADYEVLQLSGSTFRYHLAVYKFESHTVFEGGVGEVNTTDVWINQTCYYSNGTLYSELSIPFSLFFGGGDLNWFIASGLKPGDASYWGKHYIQETVTMFAAGASRQVNMLSLLGGDVQSYWDEETGLLIKSCYKPWSDQPNWLNVTLEQTTAWQPTEKTFPVLVVVAIVGVPVVCASVVLLSWLRRGRRQISGRARSQRGKRATN